MINIITSHGMQSSMELKERIEFYGGKAKVYDVREQYVGNLRGIVFSYGSSERTIEADKRYNCVSAVKRCVDKAATFAFLAEEDVPIPNWTKSRRVASEWDVVVCRESATGRRNEGMDYWYKSEGNFIPRCELYTEYFFHVREYRVVVALGEVFVYYKKYNLATDEWVLTYQKARKDSLQERMGKHAIIAAKALDIDYVGFDVVVNGRGKYVFLEANSSPIMCEEVLDFLAKKLIAECK